MKGIVRTVRIILGLIMLSSLTLTLSQGPSLASTFWANYGVTGFSGASSAKPTADGGYIVAGGESSSVNGPADFWILKLDRNGSPQWQKTYGGAGHESANSIQQTTDGGYIVAGYTDSSGAGDYDIWVLKLDGNGNVLWQKTYGGTGYDFASSVRETNDGGYVVAGGTDSFGAGEMDIWVLKLDGNGDVLWEKTYGGMGIESASCIEQTADGGYVVAGGSWSFGAGDYDFLVLKLDASGNVLWQNTYGGVDYDAPSSVEEIANDGYIVAGESNSFGNGNYNFFLVKLDWNGDVGKICSNVYHSTRIKPGTPSAVVNQISITVIDSNAEVSATSVTPKTTSAMTESCLSDVTALTLSSPNGGESWTAGTSQTIKWSYTGNPGTTVKIELIKGGGNPTTIVDSTPIGTGGSGTYAWAIGAGQTPGGDYRVRITSSTYSDTSNGDFTIAPVPTITVTSPNGGETWAAGTTQAVTWTYTGNAGTTVAIDLIKGGGNPTTIVKSTSMGSSGKGSYSWKIPGTLTPGADYRVKVTSTSNSSYTDQSDADFTINWMH